MRQPNKQQKNNYPIIEPLQIFCWTYWTLLSLEIGNNLQLITANSAGPTHISIVLRNMLRPELWILFLIFFMITQKSCSVYKGGNLGSVRIQPHYSPAKHEFLYLKNWRKSIHYFCLTPCIILVSHKTQWLPTSKR